MVCGVFGQCSETTSALGSAASRSGACAAPAASISARLLKGSCTTTRISIASSRFTSRVPMRPKPTTSAVLPSRSNGIAPSRLFQLPLFTSVSSSAARLASASIMNSAASATDGELAVPAVISGMPRALSAATSTAS